MIPFSPPRVDKKQYNNKVNENFGHELESLRNYFNIPGLAVLVSKNGNILYESYKGVANIETEIPLDDTVQFPLGSLTKIFMPNLKRPSKPQETLNMELSHPLIHTTQKSYKELIREHIIGPLKMHSTYFLSDYPQCPISLASPHIVGENISVGHLEYGLDEVSGLVSTVRDLHKFSKALDDYLYPFTNIEMNSSGPMSLDTSGCPTWRYQKVHGEEILWSHGQMDCYASIFIKIPGQGLTFILLSNSSVLTEAAKLSFGNILNSLFAQCFFKYYVDSSHFFYQGSIISNDEVTAEIEYAQVDHLLSIALAYVYKATLLHQELPSCVHLLGRLFQAHPNYLSFADFTLLHILCQIKEVCYARKLMPVNRFDKQILSIARHLLSKDKDNPLINTYLGSFYQKQGNLDLARKHFSRVVMSKDSVHNWYTGQALQWMKERMNPYDDFC